MTHGVRRRLAAVLAALALLTGCGASAGEIGPTGVDGLQIPTPTPDPGDFVAAIDNPRLPLVPGTAWQYEERDADGELRGSVTVTVAEGTREVAGVEATVVTTVRSGARDRADEEVEAWYAQDRRGNVWLLGQTGEHAWEAGVDGAEAGLAMPAQPRVGDGYRTGLAPGVFEERVTVLETAVRVELPAGAWDDALHTEVTAVDGTRRHAFHVPGLGLAAERDLDTGRVLELSTVTRP